MAARAEGASSIGVIRGFYYMLKVVLAVLVDVVAKPAFTRRDIEKTLARSNESNERECR
jgi:hypothetical protein